MISFSTVSIPVKQGNAKKEATTPSNQIVIDVVRFLKDSDIPERKVGSFDLKSLEPADIAKIEEFEKFVSGLIDKLQAK